MLCTFFCSFSPIVIRTHPESQAVLLGDDLVLHCVAEMAEPGDGESLHFHWELNGFATAQIQQKVLYMFKILCFRILIGKYT